LYFLLAIKIFKKNGNVSAIIPMSLVKPLITSCIIIKGSEPTESDTRPLYDRLQEQRLNLTNQLFEESRDTKWIRTLDDQDLQFLEAVEETKRERERMVVDETERLVKEAAMVKRTREATVALGSEEIVSPLNKIKAIESTQKTLLKSAIVKKNKPKE